MSSLVDLIENVDDGKEKRERHINDISYSRSALMKTNNCRGCAMIRKKSRKCEKCGKILANRQSLWKHKQIHLPENSKIPKKNATIARIHLKWNGKCWETMNKDIHYRLNLGRDLCSLVEKGAIKEEVLNSSQKEYIQMYKNLFIEDI